MMKACSIKVGAGAACRAGHLIAYFTIKSECNSWVVAIIIENIMRSLQVKSVIIIIMFLGGTFNMNHGLVKKNKHISNYS